MGMSGGSVRALTSVTVNGVYPPQGVAGDSNPLRDNALRLFTNDALTTLEFGTGDGTIDRTTLSPRSVPAGGSVTWDLYTGTDLRDLVGLTAPFRIVRQVKISILSGGASGVRIGGAASNEWLGWFAAAGDKVDIYAGGPPFWQGNPQDGKAVTSTTKNLKVENLSTTVECVLMVLVTGSVFSSGMAMGPVGLTYP